MQNFIREYLDEWSRRRKSSRKISLAVMLMAVIVAGGVISFLVQYGIAMTEKPKCGLTEHGHGEGCFGQQIVCAQEEGEEHQHTDACYEDILSCAEQEHVHTDICFSDVSAGVEDQSVWDGQYAAVEWKGNWAEDLLTAARMQLGYQENEDNFTVAEDGSHKGYTRYGQFCGDPYRDWDAAFVNFCMHYAKLGETGLFPSETDSAAWRDAFAQTREGNAAFLAAPADYKPKAGDIVFLQKGQEETASQMAVVSGYHSETNEITVIEGNSGNTVRENRYQAAEAYVSGYLKMAELEAAYKGDASSAADAKSPKTEEQIVAESPETEEQGVAESPAETEREVASDPVGDQGQTETTNPITGDQAYVSEIRIKDIADGAAPFDADDGLGNDSNTENRRVRTFDTVTYHFLVDMKSWDNQKNYSEARVKLEFVLPLSEKEAVFDQSAMAWMDASEGYAPVLTVEEREIGGVTKECQILTCYKHLLPSADNRSVVPGQFGENVTINVKSMKNGEKFAPLLSAAMEYGTWEGACDKEGHIIDGQPAIEKKSVMAEEVEVTAAPKYNIQILGDQSYSGTFDFSSGNDAARNKEKGSVTGRIMKMGITIQLYNDNASKGLKGIDLPTGDIEFDLELGSKYTINTPAKPEYWSGQVVEIPTESDYAPLLWSYGENRWVPYGEENTDGRVLYDSNVCSPYAPYFEGIDASSCKKSGIWQVSEQSGSTVHITIKDYEIDLSQMPTQNMDKSKDVYGAHIGCFSAGGLWVVQPFNRLNSDSKEPDYDVVTEYGPGAFATEAVVKNLKTQTVSGTEVSEEKGFVQTRTDDDRLARTLELTLRGAMQNRVRYAGTDTEKGAGIDENGDGRDYAAVGSDLWLMGGISYSDRQVEAQQLYWGTNLTKFYGSAIELQEGTKFKLDGGASLDGNTKDEDLHDNILIYYAVKRDGKDWTSDKELQNTYEDDLVFYKDLQEIPEGDICVGILFCFKGPGPVGENDPYYRAFHKAKIRDDMDLAGETFMLASTSRVWTKSKFEQTGMTLDQVPDWSDPDTKLASFGDACYLSANIEGSVYYIKETYKEDGSGIVGTHNSDHEHWGDTLLIIGYKTGITKNLLQKENNNEEKKTFNLDADQRVVDYVLQPKTEHEKDGKFDRKDTVTIVDTLPKYMTYKPGSAYFGGKYVQTSANGGTKGQIVADDDGNEPELREPDEIQWNAEDGTQTLKWVIKDVKIGEPMQPIYYSADIGSKSNPQEDVGTGTTSLTNKTYITSMYDRRDPLLKDGNYAEEGIAVTRGSASSFGKYTKQKVVDEDGEIDYVVYFNNNASETKPFAIMDTMPADQINGSDFTGEYLFAGWDIDAKSTCDISKLKIYYTMDERYKDMVIRDIEVTPGKTDPFEGLEGWKRAEIGADRTIALPVLEGGARHPVAWSVVGELDNSQSVYVNLKIKLEPEASETSEKETNYFVNLLSSGDTTTTTENPTVRRTLSGLTWMDYNRDGIQDEDSADRISGVKIELLKLKEGGDPADEGDYENVCYPGSETPIVIETGQQVSLRAKSAAEITWYGTDKEAAGSTEPETAKGQYKFIDLPSGTFAVRFTDGTKKISELHATACNSGDNDTVDSDGVPIYKDNTLNRTLILGIDMPKAEDLGVAVYESKFHDSGFYPDTALKILKTDDSGEETLEGAIFTVKDSKGNEVSFLADEGKPGSYTASELREGEASPLAGYYYLACADNPYYVMGFQGTDRGVPAILQGRTGNESQLFEMYEDRGSVCFRNVASGHWLDLDEGQWKIESGQKVHCWEDAETPPTYISKRWKLQETQEGSLYIIPEKPEGSDYCIGVEGAAADKKEIHLYRKGSQKMAQKWLLVPAGSSVKAQTDLTVGADGSLILNDLMPGSYTITEIKAPAGYAMLKEPVAITLEKDGSIRMQAENSMAGLVGSGNEIQLRIQNNKQYKLPNSGGSGSDWYSSGGILLMLVGALALLRNQYKKALRR
ncbi:SpaA isopeptide-forming pilin-related protein [Lachnospiraceae bacterium 29-84]